MALQIVGFVPYGWNRLAIGTGYYVWITPTDIDIPLYFHLDRCWLPGKQPRQAAKAARPRRL